MRRWTSCLLWMLIGAASVTAASPALALTLRRSVPDRLREADYVVRARVVSQRSAATVVRGFPFLYTDVDVEVLETLKAPTDDPNPPTLTVRVPGGEHNGLSMAVADTPSFLDGEQVVLLLVRLADRRCRLADGLFGTYRLAISPARMTTRPEARGHGRLAPRLPAEARAGFVIAPFRAPVLIHDAAGQPLSAAEMTELDLDPADAASLSSGTFLTHLRDALRR